MAILKVDGASIKTPSVLEWGLQDVSGSDSGRTQDCLMHKNRKSQKRKLHLEWSCPEKKEAADILKAFNPEYISMVYPDAMSGTDETRTFYVGDRTAAFKVWTHMNKRYSSVVFDIIER